MNKKVAIVYDWMDKWGGVERLLLTLHEMFPQAPFYTSHADYSLAWLKNFDIRTSFIQKVPLLIRSNRALSAFFYPYAFESFDLSGFDIVISVSSSYAKAVITKPHTKHINIMLTPTRFLWSSECLYFSKISKRILNLYLKSLKTWDLVASKRPDKILSISNFVKNQCIKYYNQKSDVVYPPFDIDYWFSIKKSLNTNSPHKNPYFLIVSRLELYKRIDIPINLFNKNNKYKLIIIGKGTQKNRLKKISSKNIIFIDTCSDKELAKYYSEAEALIMPQSEDFGYVSLEAQFFGCPVISYKESGTAETIIDGKTGLLFEKQTMESLKNALEKYESLSYTIKTHLNKLKFEYFLPFSKKTFITKVNKIINY